MKVVKYPGGKRPKGVHKSKASKAAGKKIAAAQKKKGIGLFATKTLSADLAAICGKNKMARPEVVKALWAYIKKNKLSKGRTITPDAKLKGPAGRLVEHVQDGDPPEEAHQVSARSPLPGGISWRAGAVAHAIFDSWT